MPRVLLGYIYSRMLTWQGRTTHICFKWITCHVDVGARAEFGQSRNQLLPSPLGKREKEKEKEREMAGLLSAPLLGSCSSKSPFDPLPPNARRAAACARIVAAASSHNNNSNEEKSLELHKDRLARVAFAAVAAGLLILSPVEGAMAGSGGRVGGKAFRSAPPPRSAPRINNSTRTNIYVNPRSYVAPPLYGGYGAPFFGGGWGWSPFSFFAPGPSVAIGVGGGGFDFFSFFLLVSILGGIANIFRRRNDINDDDYD